MRKSGCLNGCRTAVLGGVRGKAECPQWCEKVVNTVLGDAKTFGLEMYRTASAKEVRWREESTLKQVYYFSGAKSLLNKYIISVARRVYVKISNGAKSLLS